MYMKYISLILSEFFNKKINNFYFNIIEYYYPARSTNAQKYKTFYIQIMNDLR